jgi:hypothetical protein
MHGEMVNLKKVNLPKKSTQTSMTEKAVVDVLNVKLSKSTYGKIYFHKRVILTQKNHQPVIPFVLTFGG